MSTFVDVKRELDAHADLCDFDGPISEAEVTDAENALELSFPPSYRAFVSEFGCGDFGAAEIYGVAISGRTDAVPSVVFATQHFRGNGGGREFIVIHEDDDEVYVINTRHVGSSGEARVHSWRPGSNEQNPSDIRTFDDFAEFMMWVIQERLECEDE